MSDLNELLDQLPIPDHGDDFWDSLERELEAGTRPSTTDRPQIEPIVVDPTTDDAVFDDWEEEVDNRTVVDLERTSPARRWTLAAFAAAAAALLAFVIATGGLTEDSAPGPVATDPTPPSTVSTPITITTTTAANEEPVPEPDAPSPDLVDPATAGLEVTTSEDSDLVDGQRIQVVGRGFAPGSLVAVIQCYGPLEGEGTYEACDLSNYLLVNADGEYGTSFVTMFEVRRNIVTTTGEHDCANPEPPNHCVVAAGDVGDLAKYEIVRTHFDPAGPDVNAPVIEVEPREGLLDGEPVTVQGRGFVPGEVVRVTTCVLDGEVGFEDCIQGNGALRVVADLEGSFETAVSTQRLLWRGDCMANPLGCRIVAVGERDAFPVQVAFAGPVPDDSDFPLEPGVIEADGQTVTIDLPRLAAQAGETFEARQCLTRAIACGPPVTGTVGPDGLTFELAVAAAIDTDLTSFGECVDRDWWITSGLCVVRVETPTFTFPDIHLQFDEAFLERE